MRDRIDMLKKEICFKGGLAGYEDIISSIVDKIHSSNCKISCVDVHDESSITQYKDGSKCDHIRIGLKSIRTKPVRIIWAILHEFGHHLSGKPNGNEGSVEREEQAWELALVELKGFPELEMEADDFISYRQKCLDTYIAATTAGRVARVDKVIGWKESLGPDYPHLFAGI